MLFNTKLTLQITKHRCTTQDVLTTGGIAGDITNTMLFMSWRPNFKSWRVRLTWYHVTLCKATLRHWPRDLPGHAVPFCRNMWECNNKGRSPPAVDCSTDGYLWRGLMVRCARPLIATSVCNKWLPVVSQNSNVWLSFMFLRHGMCQAAVCPEVLIGKRYCSGFP
jgi:hypothetical protein